MSPKMMPKETKTGEQSCVSDVQKLFASIRSLSLDDSFQNLEAIDQKNQLLQTENNELHITNANILKSFLGLQDSHKTSQQALQKQLDEVKGQRDQDAKEKQAAEDALKSKRTEAKRLQNRVEDLEGKVKRLNATLNEKDDQLSAMDGNNRMLSRGLEEAKIEHTKLNQRLAATDKQLRDASTGLASAEAALTGMNGFLQPLEALSDEDAKTIHALFNDAFSLFQSYVGCDIEELTVPDEVAHDLRPSLGSPPLPMPLSNSPAAKRMRVAASIRVCGTTLTTHVFKRTYLHPEGGLENILALTAMQSPSQETHLRQVFLKTLPKKQREHRDQLVKTASQEILAAIGHWIRPAEREGLLHKLTKLCGQAATCWTRVQRMENRVRPKFESDFVEDWLLMPDLLPAADARQAPSRMEQDDETFTAIWPAFLYSGAQDAERPVPPDILCPGYVMTTAQVKSAADEVSRRTARKLTREASAADKGKKRRDSAVFLNPGESPGSGVK